MKLGISVAFTSIATSTAAKAGKVRDLWNSINDTWDNELRKWVDII